MIEGFTSNKSVQIVVALLKKFGIKRVVVSPGTTNLEFTAALQYDGSFELYSSVDERSGAYMANGIASETGEPVVITCTEATASRDYFPGLTEAFYRKLPIVAVTGVHRYYQIGHLQPQVIDRSVSPVDMFKIKEQLPVIKDEEDEEATILMVNRALLELNHHGCGPVHIDLPCCNNDYDFSVKTLPDVKMIKRFTNTQFEKMPSLPKGKIAISIGSHRQFSKDETTIIENFCKKYDGVVLCDHASGYYGDYAIHPSLISFQRYNYPLFKNIDLLIHMGEPAADGPTLLKLKNVKQVWRLNEDGVIRDTFSKVTNVFEMSPYEFFNFYSYGNNTENHKSRTHYSEFLSQDEKLRKLIPELPFSNAYVASRLASRIPAGAYVHLGVSNTIRAWSLFNFSKGVKTLCNAGCRGIDGIMSAAVGGAVANNDAIHFCIVGDLMFFYDLNALGNRYIKSNLRILLINNNGGGVFKLKNAPGHRFFGDEDTDKFIAASGHFGNRNSSVLVKNFSESLGFEYLHASTKEEFERNYVKFISSNQLNKSIVFEIDTTGADDRKAFEILSSLQVETSDAAKDFARKVLGNKATQFVKKITK